LAYAISPANSGWVEGTAFFSVQSGSCCWNYAKYPSKSWAGSPGLNTPGVDYDSVPLASFNYTNGLNTASLTFNRNYSQLTQLISSWTNPTNPGILLVEGNTNRDGYEYFWGGADPSPQSHPMLTIIYSTNTVLSAIQSWRYQYFATTNNSGNAADSADPDGDGQPNLVEFAFGTNPTNRLSVFSPPGVLQGGNFVSSFNQPTNVSGITYGAQVCTNLNLPNWTPLTDTGSGSNHIFSVPVSANQQSFLRWVITDP
jgi:hypothetical protein